MAPRLALLACLDDGMKVTDCLAEHSFSRAMPSGEKREVRRASSRVGAGDAPRAEPDGHSPDGGLE